MIVRLTERQSAEPRTCGSCKHYRRPDESDRGKCDLTMPPWIKLRHAHASGEIGGEEMFENSGDPTMVYDNQTCSFWAASGLAYVQDRTWTVKE